MGRKPQPLVTRCLPTNTRTTRPAISSSYATNPWILTPPSRSLSGELNTVAAENAAHLRLSTGRFVRPAPS